MQETTDSGPSGSKTRPKRALSFLRVQNAYVFIGLVLIVIFAWVFFVIEIEPQFYLQEGERARYAWDTFISQFIIGLAQGSIYALIALGYTLVYGILFMINFAHGEVFMAGAYIGFFAINAAEQSGFLKVNGTRYSVDNGRGCYWLGDDCYLTGTHRLSTFARRASACAIDYRYWSFHHLAAVIPAVVWQ